MVTSTRTDCSWLFTLVVGGGIVAATALYHRTMRRYRQDMEEIRSSLSTLSSDAFETTSSTGTEISIQYMERKRGGSSASTRCLVLHPSGGGCDHGLLLGESILPDNVHIVAPSRVGYLQTTTSRLATSSSASTSKEISQDLQDEGEALVALLDHLGLDKPCSILAWSAGSLLALEMARRLPDRISHLVLVSPIVPSGHAQRSVPSPRVLRLAFGNDFVKWLAVRVFRAATLQFTFGANNKDCQSQHEQILDTLLPALERFPGMVRDVHAIATLQWTDTEFAEIKCPILFVASKSDAVSPLEQNRFPDTLKPTQITQVIRETGTHMLLNDMPGTKAEIQAFLDKSAETAGQLEH